LAQTLVPTLTPEIVADPSHAYIAQTGVRWRPEPHGVIRVFFRELTFEYPQAIPLESANALVPEMLEKVLTWYPEHRIEMCAMHWFPVGLDDRDFATKLSRQINNPRLTVDCVPRSPHELLEKMAAADLNLCMRFHSIVFAHAIGAPFVPFDYTAGGKIHGFLCDKGLSSLAIRYGDIPALDHESFSRRICRSAN
jgi:polysaccharide pyruvyl transferase WcaK-like protein